jgi:poly(3-hydroxybutyrate) depolymerase
MEQWTDVHGIDQKPDVDETVKGHRHRIYKDSAGNALVEVYDIKKGGHAVPVDPRNMCGNDNIKPWSDLDSINDYMVDAGICSSRLALQFWGLDMQ